MSSAETNIDLWLERTRFNGMLLGAVSYGIYFSLTIQATMLVVRNARHSFTKKHYLLLAYMATTFILATIGFAGNTRYTQTIWIDDREAGGGPPVLILTELNFWINRMALSSYYIMEWFMSALLLYRCFVIWNRNIVVVGVMTSLFLGSIATSILVLVESRIRNFYDINVQIAYLCLTVGTNILFTVLVVLRLLWARWDHGQEITVEHSVAYVSIIAMVVESAAVYSMLGVLFIASFATKSNLSNLIFLSISHVQGIAQLLIIVRVANGRAFKGTAVEEGRNATLMFHATVATDNSDLHDLEDQRTEVVASSPLAPSKKGTVATSVFTSSSIDVDREGAIIAKVQ